MRIQRGNSDSKEFLKILITPENFRCVSSVVYSVSHQLTKRIKAKMTVYTISYINPSKPGIEQSAFVATSITDVRRAEIQFVKFYASKYGAEPIAAIATRQPNGKIEFAENIDELTT